MLEKKLNLKKFLADDLNKLLAATDVDRGRDAIPGSYVSFNVTKSFKSSIKKKTKTPRVRVINRKSENQNYLLKFELSFVFSIAPRSKVPSLLLR